MSPCARLGNPRSAETRATQGRSGPCRPVPRVGQNRPRPWYPFAPAMGIMAAGGLTVPCLAGGNTLWQVLALAGSTSREVAMTDDDPAPPPKPPLLRATAACLAENRAKNRAYEEQRRRYTQAWNRRLAGLADEPEDAPGAAPSEPPPGKRQSRARHDPRSAAAEPRLRRVKRAAAADVSAAGLVRDRPGSCTAPLPPLHRRVDQPCPVMTQPHPRSPARPYGPDRGTAAVRSTTLNQLGGSMQTLSATLVVPRWPG